MTVTGDLNFHICVLPPAGSLIALKHHKDEVPTVKVGMECGLSVEEDVDFRPGDVMVCYKNETSPQVTSWNPGF